MSLIIGPILVVLFLSYFIGIPDSWLETIISTTGTFVLTLLIVFFGGLAAFKYRRLYGNHSDEVRSATDCVRNVADDGIDDLVEDFQRDCHKFCVHGIIGARHTGTPHEHDYQETNLS